MRKRKQKENLVRFSHFPIFTHETPKNFRFSLKTPQFPQFFPNFLPGSKQEDSTEEGNRKA